MNKSQNLRLNALQRVQAFLDANAAALGTVSKSISRTDLGTAVAGLVQFGAQQEAAQAISTSDARQTDRLPGPAFAVRSLPSESDARFLS